MEKFPWIFFALAFLAGGNAKGALGVKLLLLTTPLLSFFMPCRQAITAMAMPVVLSNIWQAIRGADIRGGLRRFGCCRLLDRTAIGGYHPDGELQTLTFYRRAQCQSGRLGVAGSGAHGVSADLPNHCRACMRCGPRRGNFVGFTGPHYVALRPSHHHLSHGTGAHA